jgi:hypothetical protein
MERSIALCKFNLTAGLRQVVGFKTPPLYLWKKETLYQIATRLGENQSQFDYLENKTAYCVLHDAVHRSYHGFLYFQNPMQFPSTWGA